MNETDDPIKKPLLKAFSIRTILPSVVTLLAFTSGLSAIRFALSEQYQWAVIAIVMAGVFDGLDGTVARLLNSASRFGAELDSLSDVVAFGVAPAVVLYLWSLQNIGRFGWAICLIYAIAMALRLARFNARLDEGEDPKKRLGFLTGVPAPMGAGLLLFPMILDFSVTDGSLQNMPLITMVYVLFVAMLMVSTLPTLSLKTFTVRRENFAAFMLLVGAVIAGLFSHPWLVLLGIGVFYYSSIPFCIIAYRKRLQQKGLAD